MKHVPLSFWIAFIVIAGTGWGLWIHDKLERSAPEHHASVVQSPLPKNPNFPSRPPAWAEMPDHSLLMQYSLAKQRILQDNPELSSEYKEITNEIRAQRARIDAALIQADPQVAPIVAKLEALRKSNAIASSVAKTPIQHTSLNQ